MDNQYKGMTVNERLYVSGFMEEFDRMIKQKNVAAVINILKKVEITEESEIKPILEALGLLSNE